MIAIIGTLVGLLLPAVQQARESARRSQCTNNLKQWGLGMHSHHEAFKVFPYISQRRNNPEVNTSRGVSARRTFVVSVWPYIEMADLYAQWSLNDNYNSGTPAVVGGKANRELIKIPTPAYYCPSDRPNAQMRFSATLAAFYADYGMVRGNYLVNTGPTRFFVSGSMVAPFGIKSGSSGDTMVPYRTSMKSITDGTSKTLLMAEARFAPKDDVDDSRVCMLNDYFCYFTAAAPPNSGTDRLATPYCDGSLDPALPCQPSDDNPANWQIIARSRHPGGALAAFCDGSVLFMPDAIEPGVWQELSTMNSGNTVGAW